MTLVCETGDCGDTESRRCSFHLLRECVRPSDDLGAVEVGLPFFDL
jgi:hypothetical protein